MTRFGVILSSGGSRGVFAHTGFMAALRELGVEISASSGCSAGAIVGGVLASGTDLEAWTDAILQVDTAQFWTPAPIWKSLYGIVVQRGRGLAGLSGTLAARQYLDDHLRARTFEGCKYPFTSVAVDLATVQKHMFSTGPLAPALMASAAIPGLYAPVEIDGRFYSDGAVYDLAPAEAICCRYSLDVLLIHHVQHQDLTQAGLNRVLVQPWTIISLLQRLIFRRRPWYATGEAVNFASCPCGCKAVVVVVEPELPELLWPITDGGENVLRAARVHASENLGPWIERLRTAPRSLLEK